MRTVSGAHILFHLLEVFDSSLEVFVDRVIVETIDIL